MVRLYVLVSFVEAGLETRPGEMCFVEGGLETRLQEDFVAVAVDDDGRYDDLRKRAMELRRHL